MAVNVNDIVNQVARDLTYVVTFELPGFTLCERLVIGQLIEWHDDILGVAHYNVPVARPQKSGGLPGAEKHIGRARYGAGHAGTVVSTIFIRRCSTVDGFPYPPLCHGNPVRIQ